MAEDSQPISEMSFEEALRALEVIANQLANGEVPLDESITLYERGEKLREHCQARLDNAQARIEKITAKDGAAKSTEPFASAS